MSTREKILSYMRSQGGWVQSYTLESQSENFGSMPSQISRRARELAYDGFLDRRQIKKTVEYRIAATPEFEPTTEQLHQGTLFGPRKHMG